MVVVNRHYAFYKDYYESLSGGRIEADDIRGKNSDICAPVNNDHFDVAYAGSPEMISMGLYNQSFQCAVAYPGLLLGLGYSHEWGKTAENDCYISSEAVDEAVKLGFSFDYVTGLPMIPGSEVKGNLRSAFRRGTHGGKQDYIDYIIEIAGDNGMGDRVKTADDVEALEADLFYSGGIGADIFFDAVPIRTGVDDVLMAIESITPHVQEGNIEYAGLQSPKPLKLLKVSPGVIYEFRFRLSDGACAKAEEKCNLLKQLIFDLGIGAKTNVGFGVMVPVNEGPAGRGGANSKQQAKTPQAGKCIECGAPTSINPKTNKPHRYCKKHASFAKSSYGKP
jgi:CRISPR-associated protein Cmr6